MTVTELIVLPLRIRGPYLADDEIDRACRHLRAELSTLDVDDVAAARGGPPPPGAKSGAAAALGLMLVTTVPTVLPAVIDAALTWLRRQPPDVEIEIDGMRFRGAVTRRQRDALVDAWIRRAAPESEPS